MLCDLCHKNIATVHLTEIINDKIVEMHICQSCAQSKTEEINEQFNMSDFLGALAGGRHEQAQKQMLKCSSCGLSYDDFKKKGRLGCDLCYVTFRQQLLPLLKKIHSATRHTGKMPLHVDRKVSTRVKIKELQVRLKRAIQMEEFEEAAWLRDEIKKLETQNRPKTQDTRP
jgi:protein arginine kinase activator